ncbi:MAG: DUF192 domain-containing protein [Pseudomonadota bacterium]
MTQLACAVALSLLAATTAFAECRDDAVELRGEFGTARFRVDVADDAAERSQGLMNVPKMAASKGMLFLYDRPQRATFWMRNTLIPLDMIFMDPTGTITHIHRNAVPLDETTIDGGPGVLAVLEINGGLASRIGIDVGDELRHPGLDQLSAAWPCD